MSDSDEENGSSVDVDPLLELVVRLLEMLDSQIGNAETSEGPGLPVTLSVQGSIVTGLAVVERAYLRALGERWRRAFAVGRLSPLADRVSDQFQHAAANHDSSGTPSFIHLREAFFVTGGRDTLYPTRSLENEPFLLRIPIARVDAFALGSALPAI